jgi:hypothetical protein
MNKLQIADMPKLFLREQTLPAMMTDWLRSKTYKFVSNLDSFVNSSDSTQILEMLKKCRGRKKL